MRTIGQLTRLMLGGAALALGGAPAAHAHFVLIAPESSQAQGPFGDPQKVGPCGEEGQAAPTGVVTTFRPGETISITIDEKIYHPGHYRVALAINDRAELPPPPVITAIPLDPCGQAEIQDPPVFPVLADGVLPHSAPFDGPQTFSVTLPDDVTCTRCTLQVIEYMSQHFQPCFYYHCADIAIVTDATPTATAPDGGTPSPAPTATATPIAPAACPGDCNGDGSVTINELVLLVGIALEQLPLANCTAGDLDDDGQVTVSEVLTAVNRALNGCGAPPP